MNEHQRQRFQQEYQAHMEAQERARKAQMQAQHRQQLIDTEPRRQYAVIAAIDKDGGFAKDGKIPWNYPEDLKWFKKHTVGHICVMGKVTYEDINARLGEQAATSVLPDRKCFVVSSTLQELPNATVVKSIGEVENHLEESDYDKTIFLIGGERVFLEGLSRANVVYLTVINQQFDCDRHFMTAYLEQHFLMDKMFKHESAPDLRFLVWKRK